MVQRSYDRIGRFLHFDKIVLMSVTLIVTFNLKNMNSENDMTYENVMY